MCGIGGAYRLSGSKMEGDSDSKGHHYFFLELQIHRERFAALLNELSTPGTVLHISARSDCFRDFYAEWSPLVSEGRVIKFLDSKRDVENADKIPEDFWRTSEFQRELVSDPYHPPVTIRVERHLQPLLSVPSTVEDDCGMDQDTPALSVHPITAPVPNLIPAIEELSKRLRRGAFWIGPWLALIFAILLIRA